MLWNTILNFFIEHVFGGVNANGEHLALILQGNYGGSYQLITSSLGVNILGVNIPLGNYFSFIATIISMVAIVLICCALIKKIYNMCAHIIG